MTTQDVQRWLDAYVEAWRSYDRAAIEDLFTEDSSHRYHPWDEPIVGRSAIADSWLEDPDEPGSWEARYEPWIVASDRAVMVGETRYTNGDVYLNIWQLRFDGEGRCSEFVEWFMQPPADKR
jgi:hypothetical protein